MLKLLKKRLENETIKTDNLSKEKQMKKFTGTGKVKIDIEFKDILSTSEESLEIELSQRIQDALNAHFNGDNNISLSVSNIELELEPITMVYQIDVLLTRSQSVRASFTVMAENEDVAHDFAADLDTDEYDTMISEDEWDFEDFNVEVRSVTETNDEFADFDAE